MKYSRLPQNRLAQVAEDQWGLVTARQADAVDVPWPTRRRMLLDGRLERVATGVYRLTGSPPADHLQVRAAWLQLHPERPAWERIADPDSAVVSHASAADLYGVGDLRTDMYEFTVPTRKQTRREDVRLHRGTVPQEDRLILHGLPVTRAGRMVGDLAADRIEPSALGQIAREVLERVYDYPMVVAEHLAPYALRYGFRANDGRTLLSYLLEESGIEDPHKWTDTRMPDTALS